MESPFPRVLIAGRNPDPDLVFGRLFDAVASQSGLFRKDFLSETWNSEKSLACFKIDPSTITNEGLLEIAVKHWGFGVFDNASCQILRIKIDIDSFILIIKDNRKPQESDDDGGYLTSAFPRTLNFTVKYPGLSSEEAEEFLKKLSTLALRKYNGKPGRRDYEEIRIHISVNDGIEFHQLMDELDKLLSEYRINREVIFGYGYKCEHGRYDPRLAMDFFNKKICLDCAR
jgi:hypothetical protein